MTTQEVIKNLQFDNFYRVPLQFLQNEIKNISSWQFHSHLFVPTIILALVLTVIVVLLRRILIMKSNFKRKAIILEITPPAFTEKTAYTTQQLFSVIHNSRNGNRLLNWLLGRKTIFSFEIVSTREKGIRYLIRIAPEQKENMKRKIVSYMPYIKVKEVEEYMEGKKIASLFSKVIEFKLASRFAYPLEKQNVLDQHDPVAYITGMMTQLKPSELISFQIVLSPIKTPEAHKISTMILRNEDVLSYLDHVQVSGFLRLALGILKIIAKIINKLGQEIQWTITELSHGSSKNPMYAYNYASYQQQLKVTRAKPMRQLSSFEEEVVKSVQEKVDQPLYETAIRVFVAVKSKQELNERISGLKDSFEPFTVPQYQSLQAKFNFPPFLISKIRDLTFQKRLLSLVSNKSTSLLSVSEVADLYHFPYSRVTQTENIVKSLSRELPAPLSLKNGEKLDVVFGVNMYGGIETVVGLTDEDRSRHTYLIGRTGTGKSTVVFHMAKGDIQKGRGLCVIDPHGDLSEDLRSIVPISRKDDLIYFDPFDLKYPIRINLLELTPGLDEDEAELEKELVCEGVIAIFRRLFSQDEQANAHRIEYMLRNTIYTAFTIKGCTIFTIYKLLTNPGFREEIVGKLDDETLQDFWKNEFGLAGNFQVFKMISGVTAKVGRFLLSPTAKRILEYEKSSINFDKILDEGKILICNLSEGKLSEDTSHLLGTTIITKIHQAAQRRARVDKEQRRPFYLFVDEFQNYATTSFNRLLTGGRKFGLRITIAEQSTAQQDDRSVVNVIIANVANIFCFQTASPIDEDLMLRQFAPYVERGDITNLPRYQFYMKRSSLTPEEPFSGQTLPIKIQKDKKKIETLIEASRKNYAVEYKRPEAKKKAPVNTNTQDGQPRKNVGSLI